jgi:hypothetical protein
MMGDISGFNEHTDQRQYVKKRIERNSAVKTIQIYFRRRWFLQFA